MKIVCLGEVMVELSHGEGTATSIGYAGDTFNTAIYLQRALPEATVCYATKLGRDPFSANIRDLMAEENLDVRFTLTSPDLLPGLYAISTDAFGERSFHYWRSASAARSLFQAPALELSALADTDLLYLSAISLAILPEPDREKLICWIESWNGKFAFDSNFRPSLWASKAEAQKTCERVWRRADIGLPSLDDEIALFGDANEEKAIARLKSWGVVQGALKRGEAGPVGLDGTETKLQQVERVVDSTAAGDSFNAGYLAAHMQGLPQSIALAAGHELASKVIQHRGAITPKEVS